ncbi:hypothetical protein [Sphingomonas psychrotolerans]|uniref:Uncharacterized protein n=1 Tax=Sphingomonas psychrotolerans TaxID=1327635 RepID=A0A2K8MFG1_9SPHN|nr:hypothetical protein [Sphingomonas psychrotolerans]ATY32617.1 hypothetical protein CVN68_12060 [Sphingomonas psychrotolerans]
MPTLTTLKPLVDEEPTNFTALEVSCGKFIDAWLADGGEPTDDEVVGFYSLWSQSLDARGRDEDDFYDWAYPFFVRYRDEVRAYLDRA